jgi:hypothetical protein
MSETGSQKDWRVSKLPGTTEREVCKAFGRLTSLDDPNRELQKRARYEAHQEQPEEG